MQETTSSPKDANASVPPVRETSSNLLFAGAREVMIRHSGEVYRLRRTAKGGLILTK